ncbi:MAG: hypothetical protein KIT11_02075 [Fimbriimonadaceae bacterium]|nr:hypothetical protein [Fimbriimonadaceae bacterium]QYK54842.1 MAG: hypothetical protein KF733_07460 [Fimbriimonadaceae bacterium]
MKNTKIQALLAVIVLAASASAFVEDKPKGAQFQPEHSQEAVAQQQKLTGTVPIVGEVGGEVSSEYVLEPDAGFGAADLNKAGNETDKATLKKAQNRAKPQGGPPVWLGFIALGVSLTAVFAFRHYANRVVPEVARRRTRNK